MDYEKEYKAMVQRAKELYKDGNALTKKQMEIVCPELAESEDERIRKGLVYHLQELREWKVGEMVPIKTPEHYDAWIAYLEKQKEQKTEPFSCGHENGSSEKPNNQCIKQKEQKPVETQDYSGLTDLERVIHRGFLVAGVENVPVVIIKETAKECLAEMKPAEWSEEDERIMGRIQMILEFFDRNYPADMTIGSEVPKYISWLKSRRPQPHWKPSYEQMDSLHNAIVLCKGYSDTVHLPELYEDLKKL